MGRRKVFRTRCREAALWVSFRRVTRASAISHQIMCRPGRTRPRDVARARYYKVYVWSTLCFVCDLIGFVFSCIYDNSVFARFLLNIATTELYKTCSTPLLLLLSTVHFSPSPRWHSPRHSWIPVYASEGPSSFTPSLLAKTARTHSLRGKRCLGGGWVKVGKRRLGGGWVRDV